MIPTELKDLFVPGSVPFLLLSFIPGGPAAVPKEGWRTGGQYPGRLLVLVYWVLSTPIAALGLVHWLSPVVHPILSVADAGGATAIVVLGAGMQVHRSRGAAYGAPKREGSLRALEAVRLHRLLGGAPIIATGGVKSSPYSESALMAHQLEQLGVPADKIIKEEKSTNTRDHALFVPPLLKTARHRAVRAGHVRSNTSPVR